MTLGDAVAGALPRLRAAAESMMVDACTITRDGVPVFDAATGTYTTPAATVYTGKCRVRTRGKYLRDKTAQAGESEAVIWPYLVSLPIAAAAALVLDTVTMTAAGDPALVGVKMRVRIVSHATEATSHRLDCEEIAAS